MKKFLLYFTIALCFGFTSQKAVAAVESVADLCGKYSFTATQVQVADEYEFPTSFEVTISENVNLTNGVIIENFAGATQQMSAKVDLTAKTMTVESMPAYGDDYAIVFSNLEGAYPYSQEDGYVTLTFSFDDEKNLSLSGYSIVTVDHSAKSTTILGSYKDAVGVAQAGESTETENINFAGTYKVTASNVYNYVDGTSAPMNYDIVVEAGTTEGSYNITSIAGYESATLVTATAEGNVLTINLGYNYLTSGSTYDLLGDASYAEAYSTEGSLTITYEDGVYKMTDYSVWTATWTTGGTTYARKLYIGGNEITEGPEQNEVDPGLEEIDFAGTYSAKAGSYYNYETGLYCELPFEMVIEKGTDANSYNITALASYTDIYMLPATANGNVLTINGAYNYLTAGQTYQQMGESSYTATEPCGEIKITYENGVYTMTDFLVWTATWTQEGTSYKMKESFANITMTKSSDTGAVEDISVDVNAPVEYYNLQGMKVTNPSNGIFIKKQGSKATKVIL